MTREQFAALPGEQHLDACITFDHGPDRAAIHHDMKHASVRYTLSLYPAFDSIRITRLIAPQLSAYAAKFTTERRLVHGEVQTEMSKKEKT